MPLMSSYSVQTLFYSLKSVLYLIPLIIPESYFDVVGCRIVSEGGVSIISHKGKDLIKGDAGVRCQDFFCEVKHHHPLHTLKENPGKLWQLKKGQAALYLSFAAGNSTTFAS